MNTNILFISAVISFLTTYILTPKIIQLANEHGYTGKDMHKTKETRVAQLGGIPILAGFCAGILTTLLTQTQHTPLILVATATILLVVLIGLADDILTIKWRTKIILPLFAAIPLILLTTDTTINFPFIGITDLGYIYLFLLIPLAITGASNALILFMQVFIGITVIYLV